MVLNNIAKSIADKSEYSYPKFVKTLVNLIPNKLVCKMYNLSVQHLY